MNIQRYPLHRGQWFANVTKKKYVVWHGTGGRTRNTPANGKPGVATTSIDAWNRDRQRVGAPYLVDRDGTIYQTFDDAYWIYHLGLKGTRGQYDRSSVAIELANELALTLDGDRLHAFGMITPQTIYNGVHFTSEWRGERFFAELDEVQVDAAIALTLDICRRHGIDPSFYWPSTTFDFPRCFRVATIICHSIAAKTNRICSCRTGCTQKSRRRGSAWCHERGAGSSPPILRCTSDRRIMASRDSQPFTRSSRSRSYDRLAQRE